MFQKSMSTAIGEIDMLHGYTSGSKLGMLGDTVPAPTVDPTLVQIGTNAGYLTTLYNSLFPSSQPTTQYVPVASADSSSSTMTWIMLGGLGLVAAYFIMKKR